MAEVTLTIDGRKLTAPAGALLIDVCRQAGIEVPAFCYYPGLSLQAACRMCLVRLEKVPKLQTACTTRVTEGMVVTTDSDEVRLARKTMLQFILANHPLDCPVCDAGGECELQDMTFRYCAPDSGFVEIKNHREEQKWSPVVYFDRPRCILCYRCVRVCNEGMDVAALAVQERGVRSIITPNGQDHLDCEQCGMCIDICPVGALTSDTYRYKTRPWEMDHVGAICTHCSDGCKTTLGVRRSSDGMEIVRGDNRDKSGINGDFLCVKGRYAFDFANHGDRLVRPLVRKEDGKLHPASWDEALDLAASRLREARDTLGGHSIGVIGSNRTTNEEAYLLQKFARSVLGTNNIDHHRTADYVSFVRALAGQESRMAGLQEAGTAPVILLVGGDPTEQHPLLAWKLRENFRHNNAQIYVVNHREIKLCRQAKTFLQVPADGYSAFLRFLNGEENSAATAAAKALREELGRAANLLIVFASEVCGADVTTLARYGLSLPDTRFICLGDYVNSRGAADMGLLPDLLPGYAPWIGPGRFASEYGERFPALPGLDLPAMLQAASVGELAVLYVVGSNPVLRYQVAPEKLENTFLIVQEMFLTETAQLADIVLPAANLYEKSGTVTNTCGDLQWTRKAADRAGVRTDMEMIVQLASRMGADVHKLVPHFHGVRADMGQSRGVQSGEADRNAVLMTLKDIAPKTVPLGPEALFDEIERLVPGYAFSRNRLFAGEVQHVCPTTRSSQSVQISNLPERQHRVLPSQDSLFRSGTLGRYSRKLMETGEWQEKQQQQAQVAAD